MLRRAILVLVLLALDESGILAKHGQAEAGSCRECCYRENTTNSKPPNEGKPKVLQGTHARFGTKDKLAPTNLLWRIVCPEQHTVVAMLMQLNLSTGDYLQVKNKRLDGCAHTRSFSAFFFNKKSILVGLISNSAMGSAFELGYVCVGMSSAELSKRIFTNEKALKLMEQKDGLFEKVCRLIYDPSSILENDPDIITIVNLPYSSTSTTCCAPSPSDGRDQSSSGETSTFA